MSKMTLQQEIAKRKYDSPPKFLWGFLANCIMKPFIAPKYNPHYVIKDDINECKGPCFLIYNHQSRIDWVYAITACAPRRLNFVIGYNEHFRSHLHFVLKAIRTIPKKNFTLDLPSMRAMDQVIKKGGCVCIAPEGMSSITGHNQPVATGSGKLMKKYGIPVYMLKLKGAFLTNTKVCLDERKGRVDAELSRLFAPEDLAAMTPAEIEAKMNEALWQDEYEWNAREKIVYNSKGNICSHLHDLCYRCPRCGAELQMKAEKNDIHCEACGNGATMDDTYTFHPYDDKCVIPVSPSRWVDEERRVVAKEIRENPNFEFVEKVKLGKLPEHKTIKHKGTSVLCGEGIIRINHEGFHYEGTKDGQPFHFDLSPGELPTLGMVTDVSFFALYANAEYYDLFPERPCVGKILLIVEEMHRLHVNVWKNFPWMDWIYEGLN